MVGLMTLTGAVVVDHHGHSAESVFPIIGAHVIGMYALVIVIGDVIDHIGRRPALSGGLLLMALAAISLLWVEGVFVTAIALFVLGVGWNLSFVAATAELADRSEPWERGKLLGFNDLLSGATGASLALLGGLALTGLRRRRAVARRDGAGRRARAVAAGAAPQARVRLEGELDGALGVQPGRVEDRHRRVLRPHEEVDLGAAEEDALRPAVGEVAHDPPVRVARAVVDHPDAQLLVDDLVHAPTVVGRRDEDVEPVHVAQPPDVELALHRVRGPEQPDRAQATGAHRVRGRVGDVHERHADRAR